MNHEELERLVREHGPSIYRLAYARTGSRSDAEDVMQDVFLKLLRSEPQFSDEEHCRAWLLRVTANRAADLCRSAWRRRTQPLAGDRPGREPDPEGGDVLEAVVSLPPKYRTAVHLFYYEELSVKEIAAILHQSEGAVKTRLCRARAMLRDKLEGGEEYV